MLTAIRHMALYVLDLRQAEQYYQAVFDMELVGREARRADGLWYTLPFDKGWDEAVASGIRLDMVALRKEWFVLALFRGDVPGGQVFAVGLTMPAEEIARVRSRLPSDAKPSAEDFDYLEFRDQYQITWQISGRDARFRTSGEIASRWLALD